MKKTLLLIFIFSQSLLSFSQGNPADFGVNTWNVYCYNGYSFDTHEGVYYSNTVDINTKDFWNNSPSESLGYIGNIIPDNNHSYIHKREGFPCGYYQINLPKWDDAIEVIINGVSVYTRNYIGAATVNNIWKGELNSTSQVEIKSQEGGGGSYTYVDFILIDDFTNLGNDISICSGGSVTLTDNLNIATSYSWRKLDNTPITGTSNTINVNPTVTESYIVSGILSCGVTSEDTITVNVIASPTLTFNQTSPLEICGTDTEIIELSGGSSYTFNDYTGVTDLSGNGSYSIIEIQGGNNITYTITANAIGCATTDIKTFEVQDPSSGIDDTPYGNGEWISYVYQGSKNYTDIKGYYTSSNLGINTTNDYGTNSSPSNALTYTGCPVENDNHSISFKRTNFDCGIYSMDIINHDDGYEIFIDGISVYSNGSWDGNGSPILKIWTGELNATSQVEIRYFEGGGGNRFTLDLYQEDIETLTSTTNLINACPYSIVDLSVITDGYADGYTWSTNAIQDASDPTLATFTETTEGLYEVIVTSSYCSGTILNEDKIKVDIKTSLLTISSDITNYTFDCSTSNYFVATLSGGSNYTWTSSNGNISSITDNLDGTYIITSIGEDVTYTATSSFLCSADASVDINITDNINDEVFGDNEWIAYAYQDQNFTDYAGFYTDANLSFNSQNEWNLNSNPSTATGYIGCPMSNDYFSVSYKRTNFECGIYQLDISSHDDAVEVFIDGVPIFYHNGCCDTHTDIYTGRLDENSEVEFRWVEGTGQAHGALDIIELTPNWNTTYDNLWTSGKVGELTNNDWELDNNWCYTKPTSLETVLIPDGITDYPIINTINYATVNNILLDNNASITNNGTLALFGDVTINGTYTSTGTEILNGTTQQNITSNNNNINFNNLQINNITGVVLNTTINIQSHVNFINGIIESSDLNKLIFNNNSTTSGAHANSYVNGPVQKIGNQAFEFPLGSNNIYYPIAISAPLNTSDVFNSEFIASNSNSLFTHSNKDVSIDHISICNYWNLTQLSGSSNVDITLSYNTADCEVDNTNELLITRWDVTNNQWENEGNKNLLLEVTSTPGYLTTNNTQNTFGIFTLASTTSANPLPVELISFNVINSNNKALLNWITATEKHNDFFTLEKSTDGTNWVLLNTIKGKGESISITNYQYIDKNPFNGLSYYRLTQTDFDGTKETFTPITYLNNKIDVKIYPNPVKDKLNISGYIENSVISLYNLQGSLILETTNESSLNLDKVSNSIYMLIIKNETFEFKEKIIKQ